MTLINIIFGNPFILNKSDLCFLVFLLSVVQPSSIYISQIYRTKVICVRWADENVYASLGQLQKVSGKFSLEVAAENRVALLRHTPIQGLRIGW